MSFYETHQWVAECDECASVESTESENLFRRMSAVERDRTFRRYGWSVGMQTLCPECRRSTPPPTVKPEAT